MPTGDLLLFAPPLLLEEVDLVLDELDLADLDDLGLVCPLLLLLSDDRVRTGMENSLDSSEWMTGNFLLLKPSL